MISCVLVFFFLRCLLFKNKGSLTLSLFLFAVDFVDCGRGSGLRFESGDPADFRIEADGTVFAARSLLLSDRKGRGVEIKAKDVKSQEQWLVHVNFTQPKQVRKSDVSCIARSLVSAELEPCDGKNRDNYNRVRTSLAPQLRHQTAIVRM